MSKLREKLREKHAALSKSERARVATHERRARIRPRDLPAVDQAHDRHHLARYLVLPPDAELTAGLLDHVRECGGNGIIHGADDILVRHAVGGAQSAAYWALEDVAIRDEVVARVERELQVIAPVGEDWSPVAAPVRVSPLVDESCQLVVIGAGEPRLRIRVDGVLLVDEDDRPRELDRRLFFHVRYGDGPVQVGPRVVVEARQPKGGGATIEELILRVGPVHAVEVHRRWRRWGVDDPG